MITFEEKCMLFSRLSVGLYPCPHTVHVLITSFECRRRKRRGPSYDPLPFDLDVFLPCDLNVLCILCSDTFYLIHFLF